MTTDNDSWPKLAAFSRWITQPRQQLQTWSEARQQAVDQARELIAINDPAGLRALLSQWTLPLDLAPARSKNKETLLGDAAAQGRIECAQALLDHGLSLGQRDYWGLAPLDRALENARFDFARWALDHGAKLWVSRSSRRRCSAYFAATRGDMACMELVVERSKEPRLARALCLLNLSERCDQAGPQAALLELLSQPSWREALPLAESISVQASSKSLIANAAYLGSAAEPCARALLEWVSTWPTGSQERARALEQATVAASVSWKAQNPASTLLDELWDALPSASAGALSSELFSRATEANKPELIAWLLARLPEPKPEELHALALASMRKGGFDTACAWLARARPSLLTEWEPLIFAASHQGNEQALSALARFGAPLDEPLESKAPLLERLPFWGHLNLMIWLVDHLGVEDPQRLGRLREEVARCAELGNGSSAQSTQNSLDALDQRLARLRQRLELAQAAAPSNHRRRPARL